jgi:uncharacterized protein
MKKFLTAEWRKLAIVNYVIEPEILNKYLPAKTELDFWNGKCYLSLVSFRFFKTKVKGLSIPFHTNFEEVNLRFYVKHKEKNEWKHGVVFIKEIVPRHAITLIANKIYNENYVTMPTRHNWVHTSDSLFVEYHWKDGDWNSLQITADPNPAGIKDGSEEEFITEHYWGYTRINESETFEYNVEHPRWQVYDVKEHSINVNFGKIYGQEFSHLAKTKPKSVFLAEGSEIIVKKNFRL